MENNNIFIGVYLGSMEKAKKDNPNEHYGVISLYFNGTYEKEGVVTPWYSVQETYFEVNRMKELTKDIPFGSKVEAEYECGYTPGSKQRLIKLTVVE